MSGFAGFDERTDLSRGARGTVTIIEGDNLDVLDRLQHAMAERVDLIYIDPPYNTGASFRYRDAWFDGPDRDHAAWAKFMRERLMLAATLLKPAGVLAVSIDHNELAHLKLVIDEVLGQANLLGVGVRHAHARRQDVAFLDVAHDFCLYYARDEASLQREADAGRGWGTPLPDWSGYAQLATEVCEGPGAGVWARVTHGDPARAHRFRHYRQFDFIDEVGVFAVAPIESAGGRQAIELPGSLPGQTLAYSRSRYSQAAATDLLRAGRLYLPTARPGPTGVRRYLGEGARGKLPGSTGDAGAGDIAGLAALGIAFEHPKPMAFVERIVQAGPRDALVLDFFAGSGTTGCAVVRLNQRDGGRRRVILADSPENAICEEVTYRGVAGRCPSASVRYYRSRRVGSSASRSSPGAASEARKR